MALRAPSSTALRFLSSTTTTPTASRSMHTRAILSPGSRLISSPWRQSHRPQLTRPRRRSQVTRQYSSSGPGGDRSKFVYKIAAAFSGKGEKFDKDKYHVRYDSTDGTHWKADQPIAAAKARATRHKSGQDAFFVSSVGKTDAVAFGVADGVGGYSDQGIDSAAFSHGLCDYMFDSAATFPERFEAGRSRLPPLALLQEGYNRLCHDESIEGGGSTACIAVAEPDGVLNVANLGDSGFVQLRLNAVHHYSEPQTHAFNTPFQLSTIPPKLLAQISSYGGKSPFSDMPADSEVTEHELRHGDILIFATDGVWDNLSAQDVLVSVTQTTAQTGAWSSSATGAIEISKTMPFLTGREQPPGSTALQTQIAVNLVTKTKAASLDKKRNGPFAKAVHQEFPQEHWSGGKVDDICVVVAIVLEEDGGVIQAKL